MKYKSLELFSGAGGSALGLEKSGIEVQGLVETNKDCIATLKINRPEWNVIHKDIREFDPIGFKGVEIITSSPPCQSFSTQGNNLGFNDTRGTLFYEVFRIVKELNPKIFTMENVKGLLSNDKGNTFKTIQQSVEDLGYNFNYQVLNSWDYGVPQTRQRVIMVCTRKDLPNTFKFPEPLIYKPVLRDFLFNLPESTGYNYNETEVSFYSQIPEGGNWKSVQDDPTLDGWLKKTKRGGMTGVLKRLSYDKPAPTLVCNPRNKTTSCCHPTEIRPLNLIEYSRTQTFPLDYQFIGSRASVYRQIGNAVPVELAYHIGLSIIEYLDNL